MPLRSHAATRSDSAWFRRTLPVLALAATATACDSLAESPLDLLFSLNSEPDYTIVAVDTTYTALLTDLSTLTFQINVKNLGDGDERATAVSMYVDGQYVQEVGVPGLPSQADTTVEVHWAAEAGTHEIIFGVDSPAADTSFIVEGNEANNLDTISISVSYGMRQVVDEDTFNFSELPSGTLNDSLVQQVLNIAADSGYSVGPSTPMIRTRYAEGDITAFYIPLGGFGAPADSGALLTIVTDTADGGGTIPFITRVIDTTAFVAYNSQGGVRFERSGGVRQVTMLNAQSSVCVEGTVWGCVVQKGVAAISTCSDSVHVRMRPHTPIAELAHTLSDGGCGVSMPAFPSTKNKLRDNPPSVFLSGFAGNACHECDGPDLLTWWQPGWVFNAEDDRGPVTYLTDRVWLAPCGGGSHTFSARDGVGQVITIILTVPSGPRLRWPNHAYCHNQGSGS